MAREQHDLATSTEVTIMGALDALRRRAMEPGSLTRPVKELIALAVALRGGNDTSIAYHVHNAIEAGCTNEDISETVDVAVMVAGEAAAVHAVQVQKALADGENADGESESFRRFAQQYYD